MGKPYCSSCNKLTPPQTSTSKLLSVSDRPREAQASCFGYLIAQRSTSELFSVFDSPEKKKASCLQYLQALIQQKAEKRNTLICEGELPESLREIRMIQLLFLVLLMQGTVTFLLMVKIGPLRELTMKGLDQLKTGKGPATMKTLACTLGVIFLSSPASIVKIQNKDSKLGIVTSMDPVLWRTHLLVASLTGELVMCFSPQVISEEKKMRQSSEEIKWECMEPLGRHQFIKEYDGNIELSDAQAKLIAWKLFFAWKT